jgi:hypothetical protein
MIIGVAFRSMALEDGISLANDSIIPKQYASHIGDT